MGNETADAEVVGLRHCYDRAEIQEPDGSCRYVPTKARFFVEFESFTHEIFVREVSERAWRRLASVLRGEPDFQSEP
jgi:hypothetical protein